MKNRLGGTVNDVVLANVAGALRRFLSHRGEDVRRLDFRAMVPAPLPLDEPDPRRRLARIVETTATLKASKLPEGIETIEKISEWGLTIA